MFRANTCGYVDMWIYVNWPRGQSRNETQLNWAQQKFAAARLSSAFHVFSWFRAAVKCIYFTLFSTFIGILQFIFFLQAKSATEVAGNQHFFFVTANCNKIYFIRKCCTALDGIAVMHFGKFNF